IEEQLLREPVVNYFRHYEDVVQTVADKLGRQVAPLRIEDGDVAICPEPFKELFSSFVHAFRNAVDHGIEPPEEREMAGKSREGQLVLKFSEFNREGTRWIRIELQDDGKGIFADELRKKLTSIYPDRDWM